MYSTSSILLLLLIQIIANVVTANPCTNYTSINDPYRSTKYRWDPKFAAICDDKLVEGWYRFTSIVGGKMPTTKPEPNHCGTKAPIWIRDTHPATKGEEKKVTACTNVYNHFGGCLTKTTISVKLCSGNFFVYKLKPTLGCAFAYCAGDKVPCPRGKVGIEPNCTDSTTTIFPFGLVPLPDITYRKKPSSPVAMLCKYQFPCWRNVSFLIEWFTEGYLVKNDTISGNEQSSKCNSRSSVLISTDTNDKTYFRPGHRIRCKLRMKYNTHVDNQWTSSGRDSQEFFVGIEVKVSPNHGRVGKCNPGKEKNIVVAFIPTIPIEGHAVPIKILVPPDKNNRNWNSVPVITIVKPSCDLKLPVGMVPGQKKSITITVQCTQLNIPNIKINYHFIVEVSDNTFWSLYRMNSIQVAVKNTKQRLCKTTTDPHYFTFDKKMFYLDRVTGEFLLYNNTKTNTEIHTRVWVCSSWDIICNCGVAIREGADIIIFTVCNQLLVQEPRLLRIEVRSERGLAPGTHIYRTFPGHFVRYHVVLPSGTRVKVDRYDWGLNIYVTAFQQASNVVRGLCGNFNGNKFDDFNDGGDGQKHTDKHDFARSWRIPKDKSLFDRWIANPNQPVNGQNAKGWCTCPPNSATFDEDRDCQNVLSRFQSFAKKTGKEIVDDLNKRRKRSIQETIYSDDHILHNEEKSFFIDEHDAYFASTRIRARRKAVQYFMTKENATRLCERMIKDTAGGKMCKEVPGFDLTESITQCAIDLQLTGDMNFINAGFDTMKESCEETALKNVSLYQKDASGKLEPPSEIGNNLCPSDCSNHGNCTNRTCICEEGYTSNDCSMSIKAVPELLGIFDGGLCDIRRRPCKKTDIFGQEMIDSENLTCHTQEFEVFPSIWVINSSVFKLPGEMFDIFGVRCQLPDPPTKLGDYDSEGTPAGGLWISISNDGKHISQRRMRFVSYDSVCMTCNKTGNCSLKNSSCLIRGHCFAANQSNPRDWCQQCMPGSSQRAWLRRKDNRPPSFHKNQSTAFALVGELLPLQLQASDPDNRPVKYSLLNSTARDGYTFTSSGLLTWNVTSRGNKKFTFSVTDECNATDVVTITIHILVCPCKNGGKCVPHPYHPRGSGQYTCKCPKGFTDEKCGTNIDDCVSVHCGNGNCVDGINSYTCICDEGFTGKKCQTNIDDCFSINCGNGNCIDGINNYTCNCSEGFTGDKCQINGIDDCVSVNCGNGTCIDGINNYTCQCTEGFIGKKCQINIDECISVSCGNGTCVDGINNYTCNCVEGFTGDKCQINIDDCVSINCGNGTCVDGINNYKCNCIEGFTGEKCQMNIDDCVSVDCGNGTCKDGINNFTCQCNSGYTGFLCNERASTTKKLTTTEASTTTKPTTTKASTTTKPTTTEASTTTKPTTTEDIESNLKSKEPETTATTTTLPEEEQPSTITKQQQPTSFEPSEEQKVEAQIRLLMDWKTDYENKESDDYIVLVRRIEKNIMESYTGEKSKGNLIAVRVLSLRKGSIIVEFQLVFKKKPDDPLLALKKNVEDGKMGTLSVDSTSLKIKDKKPKKDYRHLIIIIPVTVGALIVLVAVVVFIYRSQRCRTYRLRKHSKKKQSGKYHDEFNLKETWNASQRNKTVNCDVNCDDFSTMSNSNSGFQG